MFHRFEGSGEEAKACKEAVRNQDILLGSTLFSFSTRESYPIQRWPLGSPSTMVEQSSPKVRTNKSLNSIKLVSQDWDDTREKFEADLEEVLGKKNRTIECYALIATAVKYIYDRNKEVFESLGRTWEEMMTDFLPGKFRDAVRETHPEISRPDLVLKNYLRDLLRILSGLSISEVEGLSFVTLKPSLKTRS